MPRPRCLHPRLPTRDTVRLLLAPALVFIATGLDRGYQTDYWQHLARGRLIAQERSIVSTDRFTFTAAATPLVDNNWLAQLLYYAVHQRAGLEGVQIVNSLALAGTFLLLVVLSRRTSGSSGRAATAGVVAFFGLWQSFLIRPQTFSMLLFVALYALLEAARQRPKLLAWAPAIMALWANVHGGFAAGLVLIFAFTLGAAWETIRGNRSDEGDSAAPHPSAPLQRRVKRSAAPDAYADTAAALASCAPVPAIPRVPSAPASNQTSSRQLFRLVWCLLLSTLATLANPYGWDVYRYAGRLSAVGVARGIEEWLPPSPGSVNGLVFAATLALLAFAVLVRKRRPTAREASVLLCFALPACVSVRMTVWWFLAAAPVLARLSTGLTLRRDDPTAPPLAAWRSWRPMLPLGALSLACVLSLPALERFNPVLGTFRPGRRAESDVAAVAAALPERAGTGPRSRVFARMEWANYLAWSAADRSAVFVEGHVELYPEETWRRYLAVSAGRPGWEGVLEAYAVDYLLLDETYHVALLEQVRQSVRWSQRTRSGPAVLFERRDVAASPGAAPAPGPAAPARASGPSPVIANGDF